MNYIQQRDWEQYIMSNTDIKARRIRSYGRAVVAHAAADRAYRRASSKFSTSAELNATVDAAAKKLSIMVRAEDNAYKADATAAELAGA